MAATARTTRRGGAYGYAALRAAVERDSLAEEPLLATRRHRDRVLVALQVGDDEPLDTPSDAELLDMAVALTDEAVRLAGADPLPTPVAVVRALETVARRYDQVPAEQRLVQLAAAASGTVLANARLELYPVDLDPVRALRLSQAGAGVPPDGLGCDALIKRVAVRFPGLVPLPEGFELARLLQQQGSTCAGTAPASSPRTRATSAAPPGPRPRRAVRRSSGPRPAGDRTNGCATCCATVVCDW